MSFIVFELLAAAVAWFITSAWDAGQMTRAQRKYNTQTGGRPDPTETALRFGAILVGLNVLVLVLAT